MTSKHYTHGFGLSSVNSSLLHVVVEDHKALCNTTHIDMTKPGKKVLDQNLWCSPCVQRFSNMVEDKDPRLSKKDRRFFASIHEAFEARRA